VRFIAIDYFVDAAQGPFIFEVLEERLQKSINLCQSSHCIAVNIHIGLEVEAQ